MGKKSTLSLADGESKINIKHAEDSVGYVGREMDSYVVKMYLHLYTCTT
jgi:hypothetical protein